MSLSLSCLGNRAPPLTRLLGLTRVYLLLVPLPTGLLMRFSAQEACALNALCEADTRAHTCFCCTVGGSLTISVKLLEKQERQTDSLLYILLIQMMFKGDSVPREGKRPYLPMIRMESFLYNMSLVTSDDSQNKNSPALINRWQMKIYIIDHVSCLLS